MRCVPGPACPTLGFLLFADDDSTQEEEEDEVEAEEDMPSVTVATAAQDAVPPAASASASELQQTVVRTTGAARAAVLPLQPVPESPVDPAVRQTRDKLLAIRVKLLRLASRLGQSVRNTVVAQVLYRLDLAEKLKAGAGAAGGGYGPERAAALAEQAEAAGQDTDLGFTCTILLLGKSGVGKSATINSLLGAGNVTTSAFASETTEVRCRATVPLGKEALWLNAVCLRCAWSKPPCRASGFVSSTLPDCALLPRIRATIAPSWCVRIGW